MSIGVVVVGINSEALGFRIIVAFRSRCFLQL